MRNHRVFIFESVDSLLSKAYKNKKTALRKQHSFAVLAQVTSG
jgi:hypothetical protein